MLEPEFARRDGKGRAAIDHRTGNQVTGLLQRDTQWRSEKAANRRFRLRMNAAQGAIRGEMKLACGVAEGRLQILLGKA